MLDREAGVPAGGTQEEGQERRGEFRVPSFPGDGTGERAPSRRGDNVSDAFFKSLARSVGTMLPRILERVLRGSRRR
jgi:uncharacterized protein